MIFLNHDAFDRCGEGPPARKLFVRARVAGDSQRVQRADVKSAVPVGGAVQAEPMISKRCANEVRRAA
jgi:hypothetical protein